MIKNQTIINMIMRNSFDKLNIEKQKNLGLLYWKITNL